MPETTPPISRLGDSALLLHWSIGALDVRNAQVHRVAAALQQVRPAWLQDLVPAYASLALIIDSAFDAVTLDTAEQWLMDNLPAALAAQHTNRNQRLIEIPVCYEPPFAPDLSDIASACGMPIEEVITRHCAPIYRVAMLGFAPGFPYLMGLDPALAMARLPTPRTRVAAGSVGIGGNQTGIYPCLSAGGWRLLGRTPLTLFDPLRDPPSLLLAGDELRFLAVDRACFDAPSI